MSVVDPRTIFPNFYDNPSIRAIADAQRWTVSGRLGDADDGNKAPIDIRHLIDGCGPSCRHEGPLRGAFDISPVCLVDLDELVRELPDAANNAFHLQSSTDGFMVVDIEPDCPEEIARDLLRMPGILYSEVSMSGRGYHLLVPVPSNLHDFPLAVGKRKIRESHGWYELLLDHWATFTRRPIPSEALARARAAANPPAFATVEDLYADLAVGVRESAAASGSVIATAEDAPDIPYGIDIVSQTRRAAEGHLKTPDDFDRDMSRYEFSVLGSLYGWLRTQVSEYSAYGVEYSASDVTWLLYLAAVEVLEPRPKHHQTRNGRPYLLDRAASLVADRRAREERVPA